MISEFTKGESPQQVLKEVQKGKGLTRLIAGGTELNRLGSPLSSTHLISLKDIEMKEIFEKDSIISIGALATFTEILTSPIVPQYVKDAVLFCGSFTRRNMATIGGNIAVTRDDSYLLPTLLAAKARVVIGDLSVDGVYSEEDIPLREYLEFRDHFNDSLILSVLINRPQRIVLSKRFARTVQSNAALTVSLGASIEDGQLTDFRIFAAIKGTGIVRLSHIEEGIENRQFLAPEDVAPGASQEIAFVDDITGAASYKRYILGSCVSDLYKQCLTIAENGGKA
jgi:putative selenate reductase FAD-binding subunit